MSVWFATVVVWMSMGHGAISSHQVGPFKDEIECKEAVKAISTLPKGPDAVCYKGVK